MTFAPECTIFVINYRRSSKRVSDLERSRHFYEGILAFQPIEVMPGKVVLGDQEKQPLLELIEVPGECLSSFRIAQAFLDGN